MAEIDEMKKQGWGTWLVFRGWVKQLLTKIVDRVFVYDEYVIAVALHGDFSVVLDNVSSAPHEIVEGLRSEIKRVQVTLIPLVPGTGATGLVRSRV